MKNEKSLSLVKDYKINQEENDEENRYLFISNTPYHLSLDVSIIKSYKLNNNTLILFEDFMINDKDIQWLNRYFNQIFIIRSRYTTTAKNPNASKMVMRKVDFYEFVDVYKLINKLKRKKFDEIFFSNDNIIQIQVLIDRLKSKNTIISYIEDGTAAYYDIKQVVRRITISDYIKLNNYAIYSMAFRYKYKTFDTLGSAPYVSRGYFLYPDKVREEFLSKEKMKINHEEFRKTEQERADLFNINNSMHGSIVIVLDLYTPGNAENYINIIKLLAKFKRNIYIKYHPRENIFYLDSLLNKNIKRINFAGSIESLMINTSNNIIITSGITTALITLPIISNNEIITISKMLKLNINDRYTKIIKELGVKEAKSIDEIESKIINFTKV